MPEDQLPRRVEPWTCCGKSMDELVTNLYTKGVCGVHVARVMRALDRAMFVPFAEMAYMDAPQPYSHGHSERTSLLKLPPPPAVQET